MNVDLLKKWLQLPSTTWPPNHYTLLGLKPGEGDPDVIEMRVLERMDLLRRFQLAHPDLVTEGMNRLAQAQICLTETNTRAAYDQQVLGLAPREQPKRPPRPAPTPPIPMPVSPPSVAKTPLPPGVEEFDHNLPPGVEIIDYAHGIDPLPLAEEEAIVLELAEEQESDIPTPYELVDEEMPSVPAVEWGPSTATLNAIESETLRRSIYRQIARIRHVLMIWDRLKPYLADPTHPLNRRVDAIAMGGLLNELRPLLPAVAEIVGSADRPGKLVATLARQQLAVQMLRGFLPSQRQSLAEDWQAGRAELLRARRRLRDDVESLIVKPWSKRRLAPIAHQLHKSPEWILVGVGALALLIAMVRSV